MNGLTNPGGSTYNDLLAHITNTTIMPGDARYINNQNGQQRNNPNYSPYGFGIPRNYGQTFVPYHAPTVPYSIPTSTNIGATNSTYANYSPVKESQVLFVKEKLPPTTEQPNFDPFQWPLSEIIRTPEVKVCLLMLFDF